MTVDVAYLNKASKEPVKLYGLNQVPKKRFDDREMYEPTYEVWRTKVVDVLQFHYDLHASEEKVIVLNIDGVPIGRTGRSQTIVSVKFRSCRNVYQLTNAIPYSSSGKKDLSVTFLMGDVLKSIAQEGLSLAYMSADAPMRAFLRNQKTHASLLGCDYCYGAATHKKGRPTWGLNTLNCRSRTMESLRQDYDDVSNGQTTFAAFGYKGRSDVLDALPDFDLIDGIPVDPMHHLYAGIARALFELLFDVGERRPSNLRTQPQKTDRINNQLASLKVPREIPRRPRAMDFKNWKCSEWRLLVLVYFPIVAKELAGNARELWLEFCFVCRAYSLPNEYFSALDKDVLKSTAILWYHKFQYTFGPLNMRYNVHLFSHLERIRVHGPFSEISAFGFEGSFAASGRAQHVGTSSIGLQSMRHSYMRPMQGHSCAKKITFSTKTTARRQDDLIHSENSCFQLAEDPTPQDTFLKVRKIKVTTYFAPGSQQLDFTTVGVFQHVATSETLQYLRRDHVVGKLLHVPVGDEDILVSLSFSQLREAD